jgi:serine/threonine protein phosphatase PrpC
MPKNTKVEIAVSSFDYYSSIGQRQNNEDNFGIIKNEVFVVCDGVGGSQKGEKASELVVEGILSSYKNNPDSSIFSVIEEIERRMTSHQELNPESTGMSTTLVFLQNLKHSIYIAWCGDSRIYQIRNGKIIYQSVDHSWVNEAVHAGIISAEEAINHPKSNVITRAIQGAHKPAKIEDKQLTDIEDGDHFLLCSDGVLESLNDQSIEKLFSSSSDTKSIVEGIKKACENQSRDNNTAIVLQIKNDLTLQSRDPYKRIFLLSLIFLTALCFFIFRNIFFPDESKKSAVKSTVKDSTSLRIKTHQPERNHDK